MDARRFLLEHPLPVLLTVAAVGAIAWTILQFVTATATTPVIRAAALSTVLVVFAAGFWVRPAAEWYDGK
jgi:hypothetical protein